MRNILFFIIIWMVSFSAFSQEKRNLLTTAYPKSFVNEVLVKDQTWVPYPAYKNRNGWEKIPQSLRMKYIESGEKFLHYDWPNVKATEYLEFERTGDRQAQEGPQGKRMNALRTLTMAELMEGKGRFMDDIVNGVFSFCEQTSWMLSACLYMHNRGKDSWNADLGETNLPDIEDPVIDLWVGETGADLAWIWYFFHTEFDKISPVVSKRLKNELQKRMLDPFYERNDYWWITGWGRGAVNNWNPWCNYNVLTCIMLIEDDPVKKLEGLYKTMNSVDLFYNVYADDGGCDEGPSYWGVAGAKAFDYLTLLSQISNRKISLFTNPLVKEIGRYIYRVHIADGTYFVNFADAPFRLSPRSGLIYRYGKEIEDPVMTQFGAFLLSQFQFGSNPEIGTIGPVLDNLFLMDDWQQSAKAVPLIAEHYFPDLQVAVAREKAGSNTGFYFAAKGGHNGEQHNHNDVGSCIIFLDGKPLLVDAGVGTYTKETFSGERYKIWTMQSNYHNLPLINGVAQGPGSNFKARDSKFTKSQSKISFTTDIAGAYPEEAKVNRWVRSYTLERGKKITISDQYQLREVTGNTQIHFLTPLTGKALSPGIFELSCPDFKVHIKYNPAILTARIEKIEMSDPRLQSVWDKGLNRIVFDVAKNKTGNILLEIMKAK